MSNTYAFVLIENSTVEEVISALQKEFKMSFGEHGNSYSLGVLFQVWETPDEFLNYQPEKWVEVIEDNDKFYEEFDVSTFNISVDISHPSQTMLNYTYIIAEIIASGISLVTKKRTLAMIDDSGVGIPISIFEKGKEVKTFPNYYCEYMRHKKWIKKECLQGLS